MFDPYAQVKHEIKEEVKMGEDDSAMNYDQDMIFRHLYAQYLLPSPSRIVTKPLYQVLLHRLALQRSCKWNADQTKLEE